MKVLKVGDYKCFGDDGISICTIYATSGWDGVRRGGPSEICPHPIISLRQGENPSKVGWGSAELVGRGIFAIPNLMLWLMTSQYIVSKSSFMKPLLSLELVLNVKTFSVGYIFCFPVTKNCSSFSFLFQLFV